jgi:hypothetical protein
MNTQTNQSEIALLPAQILSVIAAKNIGVVTNTLRPKKPTSYQNVEPTAANDGVTAFLQKIVASVSSIQGLVVTTCALLMAFLSAYFLNTKVKRSTNLSREDEPTKHSFIAKVI